MLCVLGDLKFWESALIAEKKCLYNSTNCQLNNTPTKTGELSSINIVLD